MSLFNLKKNYDEKDKEIARLKEELGKKNKIALVGIKKVNKGWKLIVDSDQVELIVSQINKIGEGK